MRSADTKDKTEVDERIIEMKSLWATFGLRAPDAIEQYTIKPGDSLERIAERRFGNPDVSALILLHNQNAGLLYRAEELFAGRPLEIPIYKELSEPI